MFSNPISRHYWQSNAILKLFMHILFRPGQAPLDQRKFDKLDIHKISIYFS